MNQGKIILNSWYDTIKNLPRLNYTEAKVLYIYYQNIENEEEKRKIKNNLIEGLLYLVYDYLNNTKFDILKSVSYDMSDIIDSSVEFLIKSINNGSLLKYPSLGYIFNDYSYYMYMTNSLIVQRSDLLSSTVLCKDGLSFAKLLILVKNYLNEHDELSYDEFIKLINENKDIKFNFRIEKHSLNEFNYRNTYRLLLGIIELYKNELEDISLTRLESIRYLLVDSYLEKYSRINVSDIYTFEDEKLDEIFYEEFRDFIYNFELSDLELIKMRYGFDNYNKTYTLEEAGKEEGLSVEGIRKKENMMIDKLRNSRKLRNFLGN